MKTQRLQPVIFAACLVLMLFTQPSTAQRSNDISYNPTASFDKVSQADTINPEIRFNKLRIDSITRFYYQGIHDADNNYQAKRSGKRAIFFASLIGTPVLSIIPTIISSATCPKIKNLNITDTKMLNNPAYMKGYKDQAHHIKKRTVWGNYLVASFTWLAFANVLLL